ncbi:MAG TPA: FtsX-like permease family protein, partial [Candidatus Limnocylindrales bacterium]
RALVIADAQSLAKLRHVLRMTPPTRVEWWLAVDDGSATQVADELRAGGLPIHELVDRVALASSLERDPIALGMVGALALGSIAAAALAVIGFVVTAVVAAREQVDEYALLRALGTSRRQVLGWLVFDHAFLLVAGLLAGGAIGALIALLVVPYATLTAAGVPVVPPPVVVVPWDLLGLLALVALALLVVSVGLAAGQVARRAVIDVLREQEV